ncbi:MAG TPA: DUF1054 domain-containing protein [Calditerricola sp.]
MSVFTGFSAADFDVLTVPGLEARMRAIKETVRPKLEALGQRLAPVLSAMSGDAFFAHVAKHARRTVNPPDSTWVAWAANRRGYKKDPHFQVGVWSTHLFVWFALFAESPLKARFAANLEAHLAEIRTALPAHFRWAEDHTVPGSTPHAEMTDDDFATLIRRLKTVKKAEVLCGITLDRTDPLLADGDALVARIEETFERLMPLYRLAR